MAKTALIISTYNWPEALNLCLNSIFRQSIMPDEIIVADDGSDDSTKKVVCRYSESNEILIKHVWQEDKGFRLAEIRNKAIRSTDCEYFIFIDGDVVLHPDFIKDHIKKRKKDCFLTGSRVLLSKNETISRLKSQNINFGLLNFSAKNKLNSIRNGFLSKMFSKKDFSIYNIRGCNMSFWKDDLCEVNGFDEQYTGWGREDSDIVQRMLNCGKTKYKLKFKAIQYHLFHNARSKNALSKNDDILHKTISENRKKAVIGLV